MAHEKNPSEVSKIPLHRISDFAPLGVSARLYGQASQAENWTIIKNWPVHRDDHYFFLLIEEGSGYLDIDFQRIELKKGDLYAISPGQLHGNVEVKNCKAWVVLVAADYISKPYRDILGRNMFRVKPHILSQTEFPNFRDALHLIVRNVDKAEDSDISRHLVRCLTETFVVLAVEALASSMPSSNSPESRKYHLAIEFKELVREHCKQEKSVQFYADALHITSGYLNEALKVVTGSPTSYWIHEEIILEAKRLLAVTELSAKEISLEIGYENYSYFNRLFHDKVGMTPLQFRSSYLK